VQQAASGIGRRNLRGRCGGSRVGKRKRPTRDTTSRFGRLPLSGAGVEVRSGNRGAHLSIARLPPAGKSRVTRSRLQAINVASATRPPRAGFLEGGKHPDCRDGTPLRGGSRDGDLGRCVMRKGLHPSEPMPPDDHGVLDWHGGGEPPNLPHGSSVKETGYLRSGQIGPNSHIAIASPILGATDGGLEAPPRTRRHEERWPSVPHLLADLYCPGDGVDGAGLARCPPFLGRERAIACRARRKRRTGSGGQRIGTGSS
jgi:hypothetical protein